MVIGLLKIALNVSSHICWKWCKMAISIYILPISYMCIWFSWAPRRCTGEKSHGLATWTFAGNLCRESLIPKHVSLIIMNCLSCSFIHSLCFGPGSCLCAKGWSTAVWNGLPERPLSVSPRDSSCYSPEPWLLPGCSYVFDSLVRYVAHLQPFVSYLLLNRHAAAPLGVRSGIKGPEYDFIIWVLSFHDKL